MKVNAISQCHVTLTPSRLAVELTSQGEVYLHAKHGDYKLTNAEAKDLFVFATQLARAVTAGEDR